MTDDVTVTDKAALALCGALQQMGFNVGERLPLSEIKVAITAALAVQPPAPRIVEMSDLDADNATHIHIGSDVDAIRWGRIREELAKVEEYRARIAELEVQLIEAGHEKDRAVTSMDGIAATFKAERDSLKAQLAERDGEVLALREALKRARFFVSAYRNTQPNSATQDNAALQPIDEALTSTEPAARDAERRIRADEREKCLATNAAIDVLNERQRQKDVEGWSEAHDDSHSDGAMSRAAACYALEATKDNHMTADACGRKPVTWPWDSDWWKPSSARRNLIKAGALILAEVERMDRAAIRNLASEGGS